MTSIDLEKFERAYHTWLERVRVSSDQSKVRKVLVSSVVKEKIQTIKVIPDDLVSGISYEQLMLDLQRTGRRLE